jgi:hypothetical protein
MFVPLLLLYFFSPPVKTTLCEIIRHPETFTDKVVQLRAVVESGVEDLPAGVADDTCGAELKFLTPDDEHFGRLLKSKAFRKLIKDVKRNPLVEATVTGTVRRVVTDQKPEPGLALDSVENVVVKALPKPPRDR